jgi:hypothetical protein
MKKIISSKPDVMVVQPRLCLSEIRNENFPTHDIVAYTLNARAVEPEEQPLLANGSETFVSKQRTRNEQRNNVRC